MLIDREKLRSMMLERDWNLVDLAEKSRLSYTGIWNIVNREGHNVGDNSIYKLSWAFGLRFTELKDLLTIEEKKAEIDDSSKKIEELERELRKAKRKLQGKTERVNLLLKKYQFDFIKSKAHKAKGGINAFFCELIDELIEASEIIEEN